MDVRHDVRAGEGEQVVVAGELALVRVEVACSEVDLGEPAALDLGAHGAVDHEDSLERRVS